MKKIDDFDAFKQKIFTDENETDVAKMLNELQIDAKGLRDTKEYIRDGLRGIFTLTIAVTTVKEWADALKDALNFLPMEERGKFVFALILMMKEEFDEMEIDDNDMVHLKFSQEVIDRYKKQVLHNN